MSDPRVKKLAQIMVNYSLKVKPGQLVHLQTSPLADEFNLAFIEEVTKAGGNVFISNAIPGASEAFLKNASNKQLDFVNPINKLIVEKFDARMLVQARANTRELAGVDPKKTARIQKANATLFRTMVRRMDKKQFAWCMTVYPTNAMAQEANMSLNDYREFVFEAGMLNSKDPVAKWKAEEKKQRKLVKWLKGKDKVVFKGDDIDLTFSIKGRTFITAAGDSNFPDGEIFTSPVENSVNGWVRFKYPALFGGQEVEDIELWFENGKVIKEKAARNQELLTAQLNTDRGARILGEWGIGTNYNIKKFSKNMLFDEKLGGTIHLAMGLGFGEAGGKNTSGLHWDMLCDMAKSEITVDGKLFYKNGKPIIK